jgi:hypothetical protein
MCKLTNLESCSFVEADSEDLNLYYTRKLADIIRSIMSIGSFMAAAIGSDLFGCSSFLTTLETEHLSLRLIARHPLLESTMISCLYGIKNRNLSLSRKFLLRFFVLAC